jgi:uncharacterized membrane protein YdjX (TVP38/TMEM64 family)
MAFTKRNVTRLIIFLILAATVASFLRVTDPRQLLRSVLERIGGMGAWAPVYFIIAYIIACVTFFPGVVLTLGAGILFGVVRGTLYTAVGATLGAGCAFLLSRYFARDWVSEKFGDLPHFKAIDAAVEREGWKIVGLIRLSPAFPFIALNFVFGLTRIPFSHFFIITFFALIPNAALFVYLGTLVGDIAALGNQPIATGKTKWIVTGVGLVSAIIVTGLVGRITRRALNARVPTP